MKVPLDGDIETFTSPSTDAESVLLRAAEIIERDGWCQDHFGTRGGPVCLVGAMCEAAGVPFLTNLVPTPYYQAVRAIVRNTVSLWNDTPGRTKAEVVNALRAAAQHSRAEGRT